MNRERILEPIISVTVCMGLSVVHAMNDRTAGVRGPRPLLEHSRMKDGGMEAQRSWNTHAM